MNRLLTFLAILALVAVAVVGCGAAKAPTPILSGSSPSAVAPAPYPTQVPAAAPRPATAEDSKSPAATASGGTNAATGSDTDRLIIRNGSITIIVKDVNGTVTQVTELARASDGYVQSTNSRYQGELLVATVTIKVPAEAFDDMLAAIRKLAIKVDAENSSSQDVTEEYVDLGARLKVYEATEQQLLTFLQKTQSVDESLKVYRELNTVRSQIESVKGRMNYLSKSAAMSNITVQIREEAKEKPIVEEEGWDPGKVVRDVLRWLASALQFLYRAVVFVLFGLVPVLLVVAIPLLILRWIWLRLRRK